MSRGVIFLQDNAEPHTSRVTTSLLESFQWDILTNPPHSPNLAPSDIHLFSYLKRYLGGTHFSSNEELASANIPQRASSNVQASVSNERVNNYYPHFNFKITLVRLTRKMEFRVRLDSFQTYACRYGLEMVFSRENTEPVPESEYLSMMAPTVLFPKRAKGTLLMTVILAAIIQVQAKAMLHIALPSGEIMVALSSNCLRQTIFYVFPKLKMPTKGKRYASIEIIQKEVTRVLRSIPQDNFSSALQRLYERSQTYKISSVFFNPGFRLQKTSMRGSQQLSIFRFP